LTAGYSCVVELTDEEQRDQEVMAVLNPETAPEIIRSIRGFVDGIVLIVESSGSFSAISFSRSRAVSFWVSTNDSEQTGQN
jgi:hypothetical protein